MRLVRHGVPYDTALDMDRAERWAHLVVFMEMGDAWTKGGRWDWDDMRLVSDA